MIDQRTGHWPALGSPLQLDETLTCLLIVELPYPCNAMTCCASADCSCSSGKTCVGFIVIGQHVEAMVRTMISTDRVGVRGRNVASKRTPTCWSGSCCFCPPPYAVIMKPMATMELQQHRLRLVHSVLTNQLRTTQLSIEDKTIEDNTIV